MQVELPPAIEGSFIDILQCCRRHGTRDTHRAERLHVLMQQQHLESHPVLGNFLVPMLVECGHLCNAQHVFNRLTCCTEHSWSSLISGYLDSGNPQHAFHLYHNMQENCVQPTSYTYVALLNASGMLKDAERGRGIHTQTTKMGLEQELHVGSSLVDMYGKCGTLLDACQVFDALPARNVVSWTALTAGYAEHGLAESALNCFELMQIEGVSANAVTFVPCLKACGTSRELERGQEIHVELVKRGLETELYVGSTLVDMYVKCSSFCAAEKVFRELPVRNAVSWSALIAGYAEHGLHERMFGFFKQMQLEGVSADIITFVLCLKACTTTGALEEGMELHTQITERGLEKELSLSSTLVDMYAKCGLLAEAHRVFNEMPAHNDASWAALIHGYSERNLGENVLNCFRQMQLECVYISPATYVLFLKACGTIGALELGREIHANIRKSGSERDSSVASILIDMYWKCGSPTEASEVLDRLLLRDVFSWNALMSGYAEHGLSKEAGHCFEQMQLEGISPNSVTFLCSLKVCGTLRDSETGQKLHAKIVKLGLELELCVGSVLVDMYIKCSLLAEARCILNNLPVKNAISWTALVAGFDNHGQDEEVLKCFKEIQVEGVFMDAIMLAVCVKACAAVGALELGQEINAEIVSRGLENDIYLGRELVHMYGKCGSLAEAHLMFNSLPDRNASLWTVLITGYAEHGFHEEVLNCFKQMQLESLSAEATTYVCCLKACAILGALETGREIHAEIRKSGLERDLLLGNMLIEMYGSCGSAEEGLEVFEKLTIRDVISWTAMMKAYGENHKSKMAINCFEEMQQQGVKPDSVTFLCLFAACSQANLLHKAHGYFKLMREQYRIEPAPEHHACIVDLLARSGHVYEAARFITVMQCSPSSVILRALLSACKVYGEMELGQRCFQQLVEMNEEDTAAYIFMTDIYTHAGRWSDAKKVEEMRKFLGAQKRPGSAFIEVNKNLQEFIVGIVHSEATFRMSEPFNLHLKDEGYIPHLDFLLHV